MLEGGDHTHFAMQGMRLGRAAVKMSRIPQAAWANSALGIDRAPNPISTKRAAPLTLLQWRHTQVERRQHLSKH